MKGSFLHRRICTFALMFTLFSISLIQLSSSTVRGDFVGPFTVDGTVTDQVGRPIQGVDVVVVSKHGETIVSTVYGVTDENGFYTVTFPTQTVDYDHTIVATATYEGNQESEQSVPEPGNDFGLTIDIQFPFEIPQFGSVLGFLAVAAAVGVVAFFLLPRKSKAKKQ